MPPSVTKRKGATKIGPYKGLMDELAISLELVVSEHACLVRAMKCTHLK
jgi:hypothetical protein